MTDDLQEFIEIYGESLSRFQEDDDGTPDPTKYHNPSAIQLKGSNTTLAGLISHTAPGGKGIFRNLVVPRERPWRDGGGSRGVDVNERCVLHVYPSENVPPFKVDFRKITPEQVDAAMRSVEDSSAEPMTKAASVYYSLSKISRANRPGGIAVQPGHDQINAAVPLTKLSSLQPAAPPPVTPVAVAAAPARPIDAGVDVRVDARATAKPMTFKKTAPSGSLMEEICAPPQPQGTAAMQPAMQAAAPLKQTQASCPAVHVVFEFSQANLRFDAHYHAVLATENCLILVYNHDWPSQSVFFPPGLPKNKEQITPYAAVVMDGSDEKDKGFVAYPVIERFRFLNYEFCVVPVNNPPHDYKKPQSARDADLALPPGMELVPLQSAMPSPPSFRQFR